MATIRLYTAADFAEWRRMRGVHWPDETEDDMTAWLARHDTAVIVAEREPTGLSGFAEVGERLYVDGCDTSPVAYLEHWYVDPDQRRQSIGTQLIRAVEAWARSRHYRELGSDTELHNQVSQHAHQRLGFSETERLVLYRKAL
jgi:aminoglycoside 6'-N-acetyltransferase I